MRVSPRDRLTGRAVWLCFVGVALAPLGWRFIDTGIGDWGMSCLALGGILILGGIITAAIATALGHFAPLDEPPRVAHRVVKPRGAIARRKDRLSDAEEARA